MQTFHPPPAMHHGQNTSNSGTNLGMCPPRAFFCLSPKNTPPVNPVNPIFVGSLLNKMPLMPLSAERSEKENSPVDKSHSSSDLVAHPQQEGQETKQRRRYVHNSDPPPEHLKRGRWTKDEHDKFLKGMTMWPKEWKRITSLIGTRTVLQVRTHAQKFFQSTKMTGSVSTSHTTQGTPAPAVHRPKAKVQKRKSSASIDPIVKSRCSPHSSAANMSPCLSAEFTGFVPYSSSSLTSNRSAQPWKRIKFDNKISDKRCEGRAQALLSACRVQDGAHSRNSVDAVSALLALGTR